MGWKEQHPNESRCSQRTPLLSEYDLIEPVLAQTDDLAYFERHTHKLWNAMGEVGKH